MSAGQTSVINGTPGGGAYNNRNAALTINDGGVVQDVGLVVNKSFGSSSAIDIVSSDATGSASGQALRMWTNIGTAASFTGSISGTTLTVTSVASGTLAIGCVITDATGAIAPNTGIAGLGTGRGGVGTYTLNVSQTVASEAMSASLYQVPIYIDNGGNLFSRVSVVISGTYNHPQALGVTAGIAPPSSDPTMLSVWGDVYGPMVQVRVPSPDNIGAYLFSGMNGAGKYVFSIESQGTLGWGVGTRAQEDTWLGRGNVAASLQLGGADAAAPISQTLCAQSVTAPVLDILTIAVNSGGTVLTMNGYGGTSYPSTPPLAIVPGMLITDTTNPAAIAPGTTVASVNRAQATVTMSAGAAATINAGDILSFAAQNTAGQDLYIQGSKGTGTGAGGNIHIQTAPAGSSGTSQNAAVDVLVATPGGQVGIGTATPQTTLDVAGPIRVGSYTKATVPSAATVGAGAMIYVSDTTGGPSICVSNGSAWYMFVLSTPMA